MFQTQTQTQKLQKTVLIYSGGLDSTVLLYKLLEQKHEVLHLSYNYGQRHKLELQSAKRITALCGLKHEIVDISLLGSQLLMGSSQTDPSVEVPKGHYTDQSMRLTVVPNRNMIMLALAGGYALSQGATNVAYAAHRGDHEIYPDCRPAFIAAMQEAFRLCHFTSALQLLAPFQQMTKAEIVQKGLKLKVPLELTRSCYTNVAEACGQCGTCVERLEAFDLCQA